MSFFAEIRRRKVFQVAAVYAVVAWLIIQIIDVVGEPLNLPGWIDAVVIVLLAVGFPIAVILAWAFDLTPQGVKATSDTESINAPSQVGVQRLTYLTHGLVLLAVGFLVVDQYVLNRPAGIADSAVSSMSVPGNTAVFGSPGRLQRFTINLGRTEPLAGLGAFLDAQVALSRDGATLAYVIQQDARSQLYIRPLDQLEATAVAAAGNAVAPFFSPDGESLVYSVGGRRLEKIAVRGGSSQRLVQSYRIRSGSWGDDGLIIYCASGGRAWNLFAVQATGGAEEPFAVPGSEQSLFCEPSILPGGDAVLFTAFFELGSSQPQPAAAVFSRGTAEIRTLVPDGFAPQYVEATGHLLFARAGTLWAMPFDPVDLVAAGSEVQVAEGVQTNSTNAGVAYAVSDTGTLVYVRGDELVGGAVRSLVWVDRNGIEQLAFDEQRPFLHARVSPEGERVALVIEEDGTRDVWIYDLSRGSSSRLTFDAADDVTPLWTPDGERIVFSSSRSGGGLFSKAADGSGSVEQLTTASYPQFPEAFSPDGTLLVYREELAVSDLHLLSMEDLSTQGLLVTEMDEDYAAISPDGRWIAYEEDQEVFVRPFPNIEGGSKWQVSRGGGNEPLWHPSGTELFYRQDDGGPVMAVTVEADPDAPSFLVESPRLLFDAVSTDSEPTYSLSLDGERFLMVKSAELSVRQSQDTVLVVVNNWFEELKRLAPPAE